MSLPRWRSLLAASLLSLVLGLVSFAHAQPAQDNAQARQAFELGRDAYERGDFATALAQFEAAYALSGHPKLLFNIGRAAEAEGALTRSIEAYEAYLSKVPDVDNREFVQARLNKLHAQVPPSAPSAPAAPVPPPAPPSKLEEPTPVLVAPAPRPVAAEPASGPRVLEREPAPAPSAEPRSDQSSSRRKRIWILAAVGVGVVSGVVVASVFGARSGDGHRADADVYLSTPRSDR